MLTSMTLQIPQELATQLGSLIEGYSYSSANRQRSCDCSTITIQYFGTNRRTRILSYRRIILIYRFRFTQINFQRQRTWPQPKPAKNTLSTNTSS